MKRLISIVILSVSCMLLLAHLSPCKGQNEVDSLQRKLFTTQGTARIAILHSLTTTLWNTEPQKALQYSLMAIKLSKQDSDLLLLAKSLKQTGIVYYFLGENRQAVDHYNQSLIIYSKLNDQRGISGCLNNLGVIFKDWGHYKKAVSYYQRSLAIDSARKDEEGMASTLHNLGEVCQLQGRYGKAIEYYTRSIALEAKRNDSLGVGESLMNIAVAYQQCNDLPKSLQFNLKALDLFTQLKNKNRIGLSYLNIGVLYFLMKQYAASEVCTQKAIKIFTEIDNQQGIASVYENLYELEEQKGNEEKADDYLCKAAELGLQLGNQKKLAGILLSKGNKILKSGDNQLALNFFLNSLEIAQSIDARPEMCEAYDKLSLAFYKLNDFENAYLYSRKCALLSDSLWEESSRLTDADTVGGIESENTLQLPIDDANRKDDNNANKNYIPYLVFSGMLLILALISILLIIQLRINRKLRKEIHKLNH